MSEPCDRADRALWITWYDCSQDNRDEYLSWLHERHIPALLARPGFLWAAHYASVDKGPLLHAGHGSVDPEVPTGTQFILTFGAASAGVFGNPTPEALHADLPETDRRLLAMRTGVRESIMVEAMRIEGAGFKAYGEGMTPAPCIQFGSFNYPWQHEQELHAWFTKWRMPVLQPKPSCVRIRKLASVSGWAQHGILYEYLSLAGRNRDYPTHEDPYPDMKAWSKTVIARIEHSPPGSGALATRIWPPVVDGTSDSES